MTDRPDAGFDRELADFPEAARYAEWARRAFALAFASASPIRTEDVARLVGEGAVIGRVMDGAARLADDLPVELVRVAGGWQVRTRPGYGAILAQADAVPPPPAPLSERDAVILAGIVLWEPISRTELSRRVGFTVTADALGRLHRQDLIARGARAATSGGSYTYMTTPALLERYHVDTAAELRELLYSGTLAQEPPEGHGPMLRG